MVASAGRARYPDLADRTAFISGGGSGIGAAFVRAFAGQGCNRVAIVPISLPFAPFQELVVGGLTAGGVKG